MTRRFALAAALFIAASPLAHAQQESWLWWGTNSNTAVPVSAANPLPVTAATADSVVVGTTTITSGTTKGLLYDNSGVLGNLATGNNGVLVTDGSGVPSISTTLPSGLAAASLALTTPTVGGHALSLAGAFTQAGAFGTTLTSTATTNFSLPPGTTSGLGTTATISATTGLTLTTVPILNMRKADGTPLVTTAAATNFGITYTPGTTAILVSPITSSSTISANAVADVILPPWYIAGTNITLKVGCYYTDSSSSATVHTMAAAAYLNAADGSQSSTLIATSPQTCPINTSAQQTFTITGTTLLPGSYLSLKFLAGLTNGGGASTEFLTSVTLN